jgi:hypothetical protein
MVREIIAEVYAGLQITDLAQDRKLNVWVSMCFVEMNVCHYETYE